MVIGILLTMLTMRLLSCPTIVVVVSCVSPARAADRGDASDDSVADGIAEADWDWEDVLAAGLDRAPSSLAGRSWVSVMAFERTLPGGKNDVGGVVVVGLALDRLEAGPTWIGDPPSPPPQSYETRSPGSDAPLVAPLLARQCVAAALHTAGIDEDDARIDGLVSRARTSALLPETRLRAMNLWDDATRASTLTTSDGTNYYDTLGAKLVLELRLTWRLDRWLYAGNEPTLERIRLERQEARTRLATRTLDVLFAWQRATLSAASSRVGSSEGNEARVHAAEAAATLDVLTGGWFTSHARADGVTPSTSADPP